MAFECLVVVRGGGDLGSGVALRLWRSGFDVLVLETNAPLAVRRTVCFSEAVYDGECRVEEATGKRVVLSDLPMQGATGYVPVLVDPEVTSLAALSPFAVVDAILAKRNAGTRLDLAPCVIGLGPGFTAGRDVHAVIETNRGPDLGRVIWGGSAEPNTGTPGSIAGHDADRVLRAPVDGTLVGRRSIGEIVQVDEAVAQVSGVPVTASFTGLLRGLARDGLRVYRGMKIGDLDPRLDPALTRLASDKALAVAGGVLEAILSTLNRSNA